MRRRRLRSQVDHGVVAVPCYKELRESGYLGDHLREVVMQGVSTQGYQNVLPGMIEAGGTQSLLRESSSAREHGLLAGGVVAVVVRSSGHRGDFVDDLVSRALHVISAVGVVADDSKHVLGCA